MNVDEQDPMDDGARDQLRQRLIDAEFAEPAPPPPMTIFEAWNLYGTPTDWRTAVANASLVFLEECPAYQALQAQWSDAVDRMRDEAPTVDREAFLAIGELPPRAAWSVADDIVGALMVLACEIGAVAGFSLANTWNGEVGDLPDWLARALKQAAIETYGQQP